MFVYCINFQTGPRKRHFLSKCKQHCLKKSSQSLRVLTTEATNGSSTGVISRGHKVVGYWLLGCCGMVAGSVVIGMY